MQPTAEQERGRRVYPLRRHGHFTVIDNLFLDALLPNVSPTAFKVAMLFLRQTVGWQRETIRLTQGKIQRLTGIGSDNTVRTAIRELGPLLLLHRSSRRAPTTYTLNREYSLVVSEDGSYRAEDTAMPLSPAESDGQCAAIFAGLYKESFLKKGISLLRNVSERNGAFKIGSFVELQDEVVRLYRPLPPPKQIALLHNLFAVLYGDEGEAVPYARVGAFRKQYVTDEDKDGAACVRLLFHYSTCRPRGNPLHYILAAQARRRRTVNVSDLPDKPEDLQEYSGPEVDYFVGMGADRSKFYGAGRDPHGMMYRYTENPKPSPFARRTRPMCAAS